MATTGDWRDRWKVITSCGETVLDVWERDGKPMAYQYAIHDDVLVSTMTGYLIPKPQPPKPKKYRPYTEAELWDVIQKHKGVLWVRSFKYKILVSSTNDAKYWFENYTHLDGSPFGMGVEGE